MQLYSGDVGDVEGTRHVVVQWGCGRCGGHETCSRTVGMWEMWRARDMLLYRSSNVNTSLPSNTISCVRQAHTPHFN